MICFYQRKNSIFYFFLVCVSWWFYGCSKCPEKQVGNYKFTVKELQINPYNGNEILLFRNLLQDSIQFLVGDRQSDIIKVYSIYEEGDCKGNFTSVETNNTLICSNPNTWQFSIFLRFFPNPTISGFYKSITLAAVIREQNKNSNSQTSVIFEKDSITGYDYYWPYGDLIFHKSLTLGSKSFTDVYEIELKLQDATINKWVNKIYYNIKKGIVGFSTNLNVIWYVEEF